MNGDSVTRPQGQSNRALGELNNQMDDKQGHLGGFDGHTNEWGQHGYIRRWH